MTSDRVHGRRGEEFAVDRLVAMAGALGIGHILVDLGRDIATQGRPPDQPAWVVGIKDAHTHDRSFTRTAVSGQAVASSGNYRRFRVTNGQRYGHLIDPRSGEPASTAVGAVTCMARRCLTAGLFSQAAFILGHAPDLGAAIRPLRKRSAPAGFGTDRGARRRRGHFLHGAGAGTRLRGMSSA